MTSTEDITRILTEESNLLLFLPVVNFTYVIEHETSFESVLGGLATVILSSILYTAVQSQINMTTRLRIFYLLCLFGWVAAMCLSIYLLFQNLHTMKFIPEGLLSASAIVISLISVDFISAIVLDDYKGVLRDV